MVNKVYRGCWGREGGGGGKAEMNLAASGNVIDSGQCLGDRPLKGVILFISIIILGITE